MLGAHVGQVSGQTAGQALAGLESRLGRRLRIDRSYSRWDSSQPSAALRDDQAHGRIPLLSITPIRSDGAKLNWAGIASGSFDADIRRQAGGLRAYGSEVLLIFQHEADIAQGYGTPAQFVAAFRHYVAVVRAQGASNVKFVVVLTSSTFGRDIASWYPGDDVVDWIGADTYNFDGCRGGTPAWRSLAAAAGAFYNWAASRGKPLVLAEWGTVEDAQQPGRKASWFSDALNTFARWPGLAAVVYFDQSGTCDWRLTTSTGSLRAFVQLARSPTTTG